MGYYTFETFTPAASLLGGILLGVTASIHLRFTGHITGMSGIFGGALREVYLSHSLKSAQWRTFFFFGLLSGGALLNYFLPSAFAPSPAFPTYLAFGVSAVFVGLGTRLGNGCTSGHGICGLPRFAKRSWVAVPTFLFVAMGVASLRRWLELDWLETGYSKAVLRSSLDSNVVVVASAILLVLGTGLVAVILSVFREETNDQRTVYFLINYGCGVFFAVGLGISGMTRPAKVLDFLDIASKTWDPSLMLVLGGACGVSFLSFPVIIKKGSAVCSRSWDVPSSSGKVDLKLVLGAALFGIGWGIAGVCPGPGMVYLSTGQPGILLFMAVLALTMLSHDALMAKLAPPTPTGNSAKKK